MAPYEFAILDSNQQNEAAYAAANHIHRCLVWLFDHFLLLLRRHLSKPAKRPSKKRNVTLQNYQQVKPVKFHKRKNKIANLSDFYSYRLIGKLTAFLQLQESAIRPWILPLPSHGFLCPAQKEVGLVLPKVTTLRITLNLDGVPITSKSHTDPSHSQTSRLLTSSLSLGIPVPRSTQCMRGRFIIFRF
jgi:hypothetical protein